MASEFTRIAQAAALALALDVSPAFAADPPAAPATPGSPATPPGADPAAPSTPPPATPPGQPPAAPAAPATTPPSSAPGTQSKPPPAPTGPPPTISTPRNPIEGNDSFTSGEAIKLKAGDTEFTGLYRESSGRRTFGAVVVLHGRDATPNDLQIIDLVRRRLPERGWASLSLTLPEPQDNQPLTQAIARTQAGVEHLKGKKARSLVLMGHDSGARALIGYLLNQPDPLIRAAVVIDPQRVPGPENGGTAMEQMEQLRLPFLDLRTGRDSPSAADDARSWRAAFRNNPGYRQLILNDPHPLWSDLEEFLINRIHGWLARQPGPAQAPAAGKPAPPGTGGPR